ncbi:MAG: hypothetical protein R2941_10050 [Desulfobacterales bacterium]
MKSRYIHCVFTLLMAVLLLLSVFPASAGAASLISGKEIPDQFLPVNFDAYAVADLAEVFSGTDPITFSASADNTNVTVQVIGSALFLNPVFNASGLTTVTVTASDSGVTAEDSFVVNIYAKVLEPSGAAYNLFGNAVAISGSYAIVGSPHSSENGEAYIYTYDSATGWAFSQKLAGSDVAAVDYFGYTVAISGDYAIVGAYRDNSQKGAAYIFKRDSSSGVWTQVKKLTAADGTTNDYFGYSVAIIGVGTDFYYAAVGAPYDDDKGDDSGSVYIFKGNNTNWSQHAKLTAGDGLTGDNFGGAVAISAEDTAAIPENNYVYVLAGAKSDDVDAVSNAGSAYVFRYNLVSWSQRAKLTAAGSPANGGFGEAVAMYGGDTAVVGPRKVTGSGSKVFVYQKPAGGLWSNMTSASAELTASDGTATDKFGTALAIHEHYILVGANSKDGIGAAYLYAMEDPAAAWASMTETKKLIPGDGVSGDKYGSAVGVYFDSANYFAIIGAPGDNVNGDNAGAVYFNAEVSPTGTGATTVSDIPNQIINMNTAASPTYYTADFTVCDPSSSAALTVSAVSSNTALVPAANITINGNAVPYTHTLNGSFCDNLTITVIPAQDQVGTADITVTVTGTTAATDTFTLTVTGSPIISDIPAVTKRIGSGAETVNFTVTDPDTAIADVTVSPVSGNTALVPASGLALVNTGGNNFALTITPASGISGQATITVSASDGASPTVYKSFVFSVTAPPVIANVTDPVTTNEDAAVTVYFKVTDADTLAANLAVSASSSDQILLPDANIALTRLSTPDENGNNYQMVLTPAKDRAGNATVTISAKDEYSELQGDTTTASFIFSVTMLDDDPPVIERVMPVRQEVTADSDQTLSSAGGTITGQDAEGNAVTVTIASSDTISVNTGTLTKVLNIPGGTLNINTNDVVTVYTGSILKITSTVIPEDTVSENIQVLVDDPDGDFLTVSVSSGNATLLPNLYPNIKINGFPSPYMVDTSDGKIPMMLNLTPVEDLWGTSLISVTVTDDNGNAVTHSFLLTISQVNDVPTISVNETMLISIPDQTITAEESYKEITFYVNDLDGDTLTLEATATSANALLLPNDADHISINGSGTTATVTTSPGVNKTCTLKLTPTDGEWGAVDMVLKVTDGKGGVVNNPFVLRVVCGQKTDHFNIEDRTTRERISHFFRFYCGRSGGLPRISCGWILPPPIPCWFRIPRILPKLIWEMVFIRWNSHTQIRIGQTYGQRSLQIRSMAIRQWMTLC